MDALHTYDVTTHDDGADVHAWTNDNLDHGEPSENASWDLAFPSVEAALKHTGKSRTGMHAGIKVTVTLDGEVI